MTPTLLCGLFAAARAEGPDQQYYRMESPDREDAPADGQLLVETACVGVDPVLYVDGRATEVALRTEVLWRVCDTTFPWAAAWRSTRRRAAGPRGSRFGSTRPRPCRTNSLRTHERT